MNAIKLASLMATALLAFSPAVWADDDEVSDLATVELTTPLYGRTSVNFKDKSNITTTLPAGSKGQVLEVRQLKTGSYGVRVKVTALGKAAPTAGPAATAPAVGLETWVYYSQKDPGLNFADIKGQEIDDPEESLVKRAETDAATGPVEGTMAKPSLPSQQKVLLNSKPITPENTIVPAEGVDPNLAHTPNLSTTEGNYGLLCMNGRCPEPAENNRKDLSEVAKDLKPGAAKETPRSTARGKYDAKNRWDNDPVISKYMNSATTQKTINWAMANRARHSKSLCYRYVKRALVATGRVTSYPKGGWAKQGVNDLLAQNASLKRAGKPQWVNMLDDPRYKGLIKSPADVPKGAVIIFKNGRNEPGDATIKTGDGYVSDFYSPRPITLQPKGRRYEKMGVGYRMIGVMITE